MQRTVIPWYYMWSQKYVFFHHLLQDEMKDSGLRFEPIFIDQAVFDKNLYQLEGHPWTGSNLKVDTIIETLKKAEQNKDPYILFTDIDIVVKSGIYDKLQPYIEAGTSMVFLKEGEHLNIGFMLFKVCPDVLAFWELVKAKVSEGPTVLDQSYVNNLVNEFPGMWSHFDRQTFTCTNIWDGKTPFVMIQLLSSCLGKEFDFAEKIFYAAQYTQIENYMKYVPEDIVPFIYRFQEILVRSHQP